ncbi:beta subunit of ATP citrate lyase [Ophidiomyces ophidiicola]|nr:beta subunit of ATP citrate lyase [Ophidiomyces ophidiicola]
MSAKSIYEADGKAILNYHLTRAPVIKPSPLPAPSSHNPPPKLASLHFDEDSSVEAVLAQAESTYPWLLVKGAKFVAKPDQLIKRRGKSGLLALNKTWEEARQWIADRAGKPQQVETVEGVLRHFLVEPFVPHSQETEYYININSVREGDWILFTHEGGVDVGDVDAKAEKLLVPVNLKNYPSNEDIAAKLLSKIPRGLHNVLVDFITRLYAVYVDCQFTYLEINPLVVIPNADKTSADVHFLDLAAKLDQTAEFECGTKWAIARSPAALGIRAAPSAGDKTYNYARTVLDLMLRAPMHPDGKVLFIGGGIANFTNVATTFKGVIRALREVAPVLNEHKTQIWVRRAGPNYQEGLKNIKAVGEELQLNMHVFGPEMHVSGIVPLALSGKTTDVKEFGEA